MRTPPLQAARKATKSWWRVFASLVVFAFVWQGVFAAYRDSWLPALLYFSLQVLGAQVLVCWHLNLKPAVAQVKPAQELADSPFLFVTAGVVIFACGAAGPLLRS
jgi:hypothetical protein